MDPIYRISDQALIAASGFGGGRRVFGPLPAGEYVEHPHLSANDEYCCLTPTGGELRFYWWVRRSDIERYQCQRNTRNQETQLCATK